MVPQLTLKRVNRKRKLQDDCAGGALTRGGVGDLEAGVLLVQRVGAAVVQGVPVGVGGQPAGELTARRRGGCNMASRALSEFANESLFASKH